MSSCTYNGFLKLVPGGKVVSEPMSSPFSAGGVGGPGHHDASFTCHIQQGAAQRGETQGFVLHMKVT